MTVRNHATVRDAVFGLALSPPTLCRWFPGLVTRGQFTDNRHSLSPIAAGGRVEAGRARCRQMMTTNYYLFTIHH